MVVLSKFISTLGKKSTNIDESILRALIEQGKAEIIVGGKLCWLISHTSQAFAVALEAATDNIAYLESESKISATKTTLFPAGTVPDSVKKLALIGLLGQFALMEMSDATDKKATETEVQIYVRKGGTPDCDPQDVARKSVHYRSLPLVYTGTKEDQIFTEPTLIIFEDGIPMEKSESSSINISFTHLMKQEDEAAFTTACTYTHNANIWFIVTEYESANQLKTEGLISFLKGLQG